MVILHQLFTPNTPLDPTQIRIRQGRKDAYKRKTRNCGQYWPWTVVWGHFVQGNLLFIWSLVEPSSATKMVSLLVCLAPPVQNFLCLWDSRWKLTGTLGGVAWISRWSWVFVSKVFMFRFFFRPIKMPSSIELYHSKLWLYNLLFKSFESVSSVFFSIICKVLSSVRMPAYILKKQICLQKLRLAFVGMRYDSIRR